MKKSLATLTAALVLASHGAAFAASTVDLTVSGLITPAACTPGLSSEVIDHGKISAKDLSPTSSTWLPQALLTMTVSCDSEALFALQATDNRLGSSNFPNAFGLGFINGTQKLGEYQLEYRNPVSGDGTTIYPISSKDGGQTWGNNEGAGTQPLELLGFRDTRTGQLGPIPLKNVTTEILVRTAIYRTDGMDLSNQVSLDGNATFEVKYL
ncbi:Protein GltF [Pseudomonas extremaustralis]|uniref:Protein GltF n=1 Tax=Pseudomonas extremaustralis TaxID=359110 RepID=A0A5M9IYK4_9PSED|nr:DUF1120 domain-containing protein [Pseudomonas extremaustralis]KAA8560816.1 Protein GltF [Pseudomonas extremaustralis]